MGWLVDRKPEVPGSPTDPALPPLLARSVPGGEDAGKAFHTRMPFSSGSAFAQMAASPAD